MKENEGQPLAALPNIDIYYGNNKSEQTENQASARKESNCIASVFDAPVSNTIKYRDVTWRQLYENLTTPTPTILQDNSHASKAEYGSYFVRGIIEGTRKDSNLGPCSLVVMDIDTSLDNKPLPDPKESTEKLNDIQHVVYSTATPGRSRIVFHVAPYPKEDTDKVTRAAYQLCRERGLNFAFAGESKTKSQPWFLPQATDITNYQAFGTLEGRMFSIDMVSSSCRDQETVNENTGDQKGASEGHTPLREFITALENGTIHEAAKRFAGWKRRTTNLSIGQIFDEITVLIDLHCSDPTKVKRWHESERKGLEDWFRNNVGEEGVKKIYSTDSSLDVLKSFEVTDEYVNRLGKEQWLFPNIIISGHLLVIIAIPGGGKTTILFNYVVPHMVSQGAKVFYIDADSPVSEHKRMKAFADENGFTLLNPTVNVGTGVDSLIQTLNEMANSGMDLSGLVFIFDTLKKFADLMSKNSVKSHFSLLRTLNSRGATCICLAHSNKYRDKDENLIPEGVGDVKNDVDDLVFFEREKKPGGIDVTTIVDIDKGAKTRGIFKPISFHIDENRNVTMYDTALELTERNGKTTRKATENEILDIADEILRESSEPVGKTELAKRVHSVVGGLPGEQKIKDILTANSALKGSSAASRTRFVYTKGDRNSFLFSLG